LDNESLTLSEAQRYAFIKNAADEIGIEDEKKKYRIEMEQARNKTGGTLSIRNSEGYGGEYTIKLQYFK
jgi:hypothetical protein